MTDTFRKKIVDNIQTVLTTLGVAGGVHVWFPPAHNAALLPAIIISALSETKENESSSTPYVACSLDVTIEVLAAQTDAMEVSGWNVIEPLLTSIEKAMMIDARRGDTTGAVVDTLIGSLSVHPFSSEDGVLSGSVSCRVRYRHRSTDPAVYP